MNKATLIEAVEKDMAEQSHPIDSHAQAGRIVDSVIDNLTKAIASGEGVQIIGFGSFKVVDRAARTGMNPATHEPMEIAAKKAVKFVPGSALKSAVNE